MAQIVLWMDGEPQPFAVRYSALEARAGRPVVDDPLAVTQAHLDRLSVVAGKALGMVRPFHR